MYVGASALYIYYHLEVASSRSKLFTIELIAFHILLTLYGLLPLKIIAYFYCRNYLDMPCF